MDSAAMLYARLWAAGLAATAAFWETVVHDDPDGDSADADDPADGAWITSDTAVDLSEVE